MLRFQAQLPRYQSQTIDVYLYRGLHNIKLCTNVHDYVFPTTHLRLTIPPSLRIPAHSLSDPWYSLPATTVLLAPACCCTFLLGFLGLRAVRMLELLLLRAPLGWPADSACGGPAPPAADALTPL